MGTASVRRQGHTPSSRTGVVSVPRGDRRSDHHGDRDIHLNLSYNRYDSDSHHDGRHVWRHPYLGRYHDRLGYHRGCGYHRYGHRYHHHGYCSSFAFGFSVYDHAGYYYPVYPIYYTAPYVVYPQTVYQQDVYAAPMYPPDTGHANVIAPAPEQEVQPVEPAPDVAEIRAPSEREQKLIKEGLEAFEQGDYERAARSFLQSAMANPDNIDALLAYAVARFATGDYAVSAIAIRRGVGKFPGVVNAAFDVRDRYGQLEDFERHLTRIERFAQEHPEDIDGWLVLGFIRHFSDQRELSARTFELVLRLSEDDAPLAEIFLAAEPLPDVTEQDEGGEPQGPTVPQTQPAAAAPFEAAPENEFPLP